MMPVCSVSSSSPLGHVSHPFKKNFFAFGKAMGAGAASTATGAMSMAAAPLATTKVAATLATAKLAATMASRW